MELFVIFLHPLPSLALHLARPAPRADTEAVDEAVAHGALIRDAVVGPRRGVRGRVFLNGTAGAEKAPGWVNAFGLHLPFRVTCKLMVIEERSRGRDERCWLDFRYLVGWTPPPGEWVSLGIQKPQGRARGDGMEDDPPRHRHHPRTLAGAEGVPQIYMRMGDAAS